MIKKSCLGMGRVEGGHSSDLFFFLVFLLPCISPSHTLYLNPMSWEGRVDVWLAVIQRDVTQNQSSAG